MRFFFKIILFPLFFLGVLALGNSTIYAHPGGTDSVGCHTCRTNCPSWGLSYGEYHCHRSKGLPQPKEPVRSSRDGYTVPAPEYKTPSDDYSLPSREQLGTSSKKVVAQASASDENSDIWWWVGLGSIGFLGYFFYEANKRNRE